MEEKINQYELHFENWLLELQEAGVVVTYEKQPEKIIIFDNAPLTYWEQLKTKVKQHTWNLFQEMVYTADFKIVFSNKHPMTKNLVGSLDKAFDYSNPASYIFLTTQYTKRGNPVVIVDVKPPSDAIQFGKGFGSSRDFPIKQRIIYQLMDIYVNKVIPYGAKQCLFAKTFTPEAFYMSDKKTKVRAVKKHRKTKAELYTPITINKFLKIN